MFYFDENILKHMLDNIKEGEIEIIKICSKYANFNDISAPQVVML